MRKEVFFGLIALFLILGVISLFIFGKLTGEVVRETKKKDGTYLPNSKYCSDSDYGIISEIPGIVKFSKVSGQGRTVRDRCLGKDEKRPNHIREFYCNGDRVSFETILCKNGCLTIKEDNKVAICNPVQIAKTVCTEDSDYGVKLLKKGIVYGDLFEIKNGEEYPVPVAEDTCIDDNLLIERDCKIDYSREEVRKENDDGEYSRRKGEVVSYPVTCPKGCGNGKCKLGRFENFCPGNGIECINLSKMNYCDSSYSANVFTNRGISIGLENSGDIRIENKCVDEKRLKVFICKSFLEMFPSLKSEKVYDDSRIPSSMIQSCPFGYKCNDRRCIEAERPAAKGKIGDVNGDDILNEEDILKAKDIAGMPIRATEKYTSADIDRDGIVDSYDVYRLRKLISGDIPLKITHPIRELSIETPNSIREEGDNEGGMLTENGEGMHAIWNIEHKKKGASRDRCSPPVLKINLKRVNKINRFPGLTSYLGIDNLKYDEFRLVPDCDIWGQNEVDNLLREYFIHWMYRNYGIATPDVIGFANLTIISKNLNTGKGYNYIILQRSDADKDETPLKYQFNFERIIEASGSNYGESYQINSKASSRITHINLTTYYNRERGEDEESKSINELFELDLDSALRYVIFNSFVSLEDRGYLHNEDYGVSAETGKMHYIPFDFDLSLGPSSSSYLTFENIINEDVPLEKHNEIALKYDEITKQVFLNPDNLNTMLLAIDKYPFEGNKIKLKNVIKVRFYTAALYYGRPRSENAKDTELGNLRKQYIAEARRLAETEDLEIEGTQTIAYLNNVLCEYHSVCLKN
ncbi:MAG: CotH kinase family protein [Nanoarchaeota archaeon]